MLYPAELRAQPARNPSRLIRIPGGDFFGPPVGAYRAADDRCVYRTNVIGTAELV